LAIALGGTLRDWVGTVAMTGTFGHGLATPTTGYSFVYHTEIGLLFLTLVVLGPLVRNAGVMQPHQPAKFGLAEFPT